MKFNYYLFYSDLSFCISSRHGYSCDDLGLLITDSFLPPYTSLKHSISHSTTYTPLFFLLPSSSCSSLT